jgi:hypothetical protein
MKRDELNVLSPPVRPNPVTDGALSASRQGRKTLDLRFNRPTLSVDLGQVPCGTFVEQAGLGRRGTHELA